VENNCCNAVIKKKNLGASVFCIWSHTDGQGNYINEMVYTNDVQNERLIFSIHHRHTRCKIINIFESYSWNIVGIEFILCTYVCNLHNYVPVIHNMFNLFMNKLYIKYSTVHFDRLIVIHTHIYPRNQVPIQCAYLGSRLDLL